MGALSLVWLAQVLAQKGSPEDAAILPERAGIARILSTLAALVAVAGFMNLIGFQLAMFLFLVFLLRFLGRQALWVTLVVALLYLDVPLPSAAVKFLAPLGL
jgi:hypothetical protein